MSYQENLWLEKYEIKRPDYDYMEREYVGMRDVSHESKRFKKENDIWVQRNKNDSKQARLMIVGDITCFERQMWEAQNGKDFDFNYVFERVKPIFEQADLVVGNLETMLSPSAPYRFEQYVCEQDFACNAPVEFLEGIYNAGFDVLTNANNHDLDAGAVGIGETIDNIERFGFIHTGTFKSDKKRYEMIEVNGIKIAIVAFEIDQNGKGCNLTTEGSAFLLNDYSKEKAQAIYEDAKKCGADFVIVCPHWGKENAFIPNDVQKQMANDMVSIGYDCIVGSHTHVIQPFKYVEANGKKAPVFFSMGNFLSHNVDNKKSRSLIACIDIQNKDGKKSLQCAYIPVFTSEYCGDKKYVVVPLSIKTKSTRNQKRMKRIQNELGDDIQIYDQIKYKGFVEKREVTETKEKKEEFKITSYPCIYDSGKYVFEIKEDGATILKITDGRPQLSYTTDVDVLGKPVKAVAPYAFSNHEVIKKIKFMDNITYIPEGLCKGCKELEGIRFGNQTVEVGPNSFEDCTTLPCVVLKQSIQKVCSRAFANCTNLRSIKIPVGVKEIADDAFDNCPKAIVYCEEGSYGDTWAKEHGFEVKYMKLYEGKGSTVHSGV